MTQSVHAYGGDLIESLENHLAGCQPPFLEEDIETQASSLFPASCLPRFISHPPIVLLYGIFLTQGSKLSLLCLLHCRQILYPLSHQVNSIYIKSESEVAQLFLTLWDPMDCSLPGFSVHGIFQARVLEWVAISFSRGSS